MVRGRRVSIDQNPIRSRGYKCSPAYQVDLQDVSRHRQLSDEVVQVEVLLFALDVVTRDVIGELVMRDVIALKQRHGEAVPGRASLGSGIFVGSRLFTADSFSGLEIYIFFHFLTYNAKNFASSKKYRKISNEILYCPHSTYHHGITFLNSTQ